MTHTGTQSTRRTPYADDSPDTAAAFLRIASLPQGPQRAALRQEVVCAWIPMAIRLARRFNNGREPMEDLRQVAQVGLVKAVSRFDPGLGTAFEAYAIPTIVGELKRHFRDNLWAVHVPRRVQELRTQVRTADRDLSPSRDSGGPTPAEIAAATGLTEQEVRRGQGALNSWSPCPSRPRTAARRAPTRWRKPSAPRSPPSTASSTARRSAPCCAPCPSATGGSST